MHVSVAYFNGGTGVYLPKFWSRSEGKRYFELFMLYLQYDIKQRIFYKWTSAFSFCMIMETNKKSFEEKKNAITLWCFDLVSYQKLFIYY